MGRNLECKNMKEILNKKKKCLKNFTRLAGTNNADIDKKLVITLTRRLLTLCRFKQ